MEKHSNIKHQILLILFMLLAMLGLTGCDVNINANAGAVNNYFKVDSPDGAGVITTFGSIINNNISSIDTFKTTYEVLAPKLASSYSIDFASTINDMKSRQNKLETSMLIDNNKITADGSDILSAIALESPSDINLIDEMVRGIAFTVGAHINNDPSTMKASAEEPSFISSYSTNSSGSSDKDGISKATVVYGYAVTSVHIEIRDATGEKLYLTSNELLTNAGVSADALGNRADTSNKDNPRFKTSLSGSYTEKSRTGKYQISARFETSPYIACEGKQAKDFKVTFANAQVDDTATFSLESYTKEADKYKPTDFQALYAGYARPFTVNSLDTIKNTKVETVGNADKDNTIKYRIKIGSFENLGISTKNDSTGYGHFAGTTDTTINECDTYASVWVYVNITDLNNYADYKSIYKMISAGTQTTYTAVSSGSTTCSDLIKNIREITNNIPIYTLRANAGAQLNTYDASSIVDAMYTSSNSSGSNTKVNTSLFIKTNYTVNLLSESAANQNNFTKTSNLYLGGLCVGTIKYEAITTKASKGITSAVLEADGTTSYKTAPMIRIMQAPDSTVSKPKYCLVNGVYRIGVIDAFHANTSPSGNTYYYSAKPSTMFLDILDGKIYSLAQTGKAATFANTANMSIYSLKDIRMTHYTNASETEYGIDANGGGYIAGTKYYQIPQSSIISTLCKNISDGDSSDFAKNYNKAINNTFTPFILGTYMEAIYCPGVYPNGTNPANGEQFICVGRKIVLDKEWFNSKTSITETTPAFTINNPDEDRSLATGGKATGYVKYLYSICPESKLTGSSSGPLITYQGLGKLPVSNVSDVIVTSAYQSGLDIKHTNIVYIKTIHTGEFKTTTNWLLTGSSRHLATNEKGTYKATSTYTPGIYCIGSTFGVQDNLAAYLASENFNTWRTWLNANGYSGYLNGIEDKEISDEIISTLELTYDIALNGEEGQEDLTIDSKDLIGVEEFMQNKDNKRIASILTIILRILGILILTYGIALCVAYSIDVNVAGEGDGILKRITFNRMKSCPGMSKAEREALTERSEKGTYTIHAIALADLIPIVVVLFIIATLLLIGAYPLIAQRIIYYADMLTQSVKQAIKGK